MASIARIGIHRYIKLMLKVATISFLFFIFLAPVLTLIHEFGHAVVPLLKGQDVKIGVGSRQVINFQVGKLAIEFGLFSPWIGFTKYKESVSVMAHAGGPLFSLLLGAALLLFGFKGTTGNTSAFLFASAGWCLFQFVFTAIPFIYPSWLGYEQGMSSDGYKILEAFRSK